MTKATYDNLWVAYFVRLCETRPNTPRFAWLLEQLRRLDALYGNGEAYP